MKILRIVFHSFLLTAHVIIALLFLVSALSDKISPEYSTLFAYLGLGFPIFCLLNFLFVLYWLFTQEWRFIWIGLLAFLLSWGQVQLYFPLHSPTDDIPKEHTIKLLTYNIMAFGYKEHTPENPNPTIRYIAESGADIVCLQEYAEDTQKKYLTKQKIYKELEMYPYKSIVYLTRTGRLRNGIAVFSKYPIIKSERINYKSESNGSALHQIRINNKILTLVNNHLESFKLTTEDRSRYSSFLKEMDSEKLEDLRGSLQQKLGTAFKIRASQARAIVAAVDSVQTDYTIICGDFNDTPISYAHHTLQQNLVDAFSESGRGMGISYNENLFWFRIDHILHSPNMKSYNCTVGDVKYSDHYPMWCYLKLE